MMMSSKKWMNSRVVFQVDKASKWEPSKSTSEMNGMHPKVILSWPRIFWDTFGNIMA
jgi:hypothetical protein